MRGIYGYFIVALAIGIWGCESDYKINQHKAQVTSQAAINPISESPVSEATPEPTPVPIVSTPTPVPTPVSTPTPAPTATPVPTPTPAPTPQYRFENISQTSTVNNPEVKVVFMVDNSSSMAVHQQQISNSLDSMFNSLSGKNVKFYVYTTSPFDDYPTLGSKYTALKVSQPFRYERNGQSIPSNSQFQLNDKRYHDYLYSLTYPQNSVVNTSIGSAMTANEINSRKQALKSAILDIGTNGADVESPFCSLHYVFDQQNEATKIFNQGDRAGFVILTDGNESRTSANCYNKLIQEYNFEQAIREVPNVSGADRTYYQHRFYNANYYTVPLNSSNFEGVQPANRAINTAQVQNVPVLSAANNYYAACNSEVVSYLNQVLAPFGRQVATGNSSYPCMLNAPYVTWSFNVVDAPLNRCTQSFQSNGITYANWENMINSSPNNGTMIPGTCVKKFMGPVNDWQYRASSNISIAQSAVSLWESFKNKADQFLTPSNYFASSIHIRSQSDQSSCSNQPEGIGSQLNSFISALGIRGYSQNICSNDYSPALSNLGQWISQQALSEFNVNLAQGESIEEVKLVNNGVESIPAQGTVSWTGGNITIDPGQIQPGTSLRIKIRIN